MRTPDKYDDEIERLVPAGSDTLYESWVETTPLFAFCGGGCLTMIRGSGSTSYTPELTEEIRADKEIPESSGELMTAWDKRNRRQRRALLNRFAEWQRRLDREIRGATCPK